jgi:hypothetical protein
MTKYQQNATQKNQWCFALLGLWEAALVAILARGELNVNLYGDLRTQSALNNILDVVLASPSDN